MSKITILRQESNLGCYADRRIGSADTTIYLRFFDLVTKEAREPNAANRSNLVVTINKDNDNHEIMVLGTVGAAASGVSTCTSVVRFVAFNGVNLTAGTGKEHASESEGGCADVVNMWQQLYDVMAGTKATGANDFEVGANAAADISLTFENDHTIAPKIYIDDSNECQMKGHRGDDEGAAGDFAVGQLQLTTTERDALTSPLNGLTIYNTTTGVMNFREAGAWVANASGTSIGFATEAAGGKVEKATTAEVKAGTGTGGVGTLYAQPDDIATAVQDGSWDYFASATGNDTYVITPTPAIAAYATGQAFIVNPDTGNTGACTLNVNAKGAKDIKKLVNGALAAMETTDIIADVPFVVVYDGTQFVYYGNPGGGMSTANSDLLVQNTEFDPTYGYRIFQNDIGLWNEQDTGAGTKALDNSGSYLYTTAGATGDYESATRGIQDIQGGTDDLMQWDDLTAGQKVIYEIAVQAGDQADTEVRFGLSETVTAVAGTDAQQRAMFVIDDGQAGIEWNDDGGGAFNEENITVTNTDYFHRYRIEYTPGTSVVFKVDGVVAATKTTNIPVITDGTAINFLQGIKTTANAAKEARFQADPIILLQKV